MKLTLNGIKEHEAWENAGIQLPGYDVEKISAKANLQDQNSKIRSGSQAAASDPTEHSYVRM